MRAESACRAGKCGKGETLQTMLAHTRGWLATQDVDLVLGLLGGFIFALVLFPLFVAWLEDLSTIPAKTNRPMVQLVQSVRTILRRTQ